MNWLIGLNPSFPLEISIKVHNFIDNRPCPDKKNPWNLQWFFMGLGGIFSGTTNLNIHTAVTYYYYILNLPLTNNCYIY